MIRPGFGTLALHFWLIALRVPWLRIMIHSCALYYRTALSNEARQKVLSVIPTNGAYRVLYGPFRDLVYPKSNAVGSVWLPKILGMYESELHYTLEKICQNKYDTIVNIGAGEGYYAVGLAQRIPEATVFAFETDPRGQKLCMEMAIANQVNERVVVSGASTLDHLAGILKEKRGLIFCDCEGCELELLQPDKLTDLKNFDLLVELHDHTQDGPTVSQIFTARFADTHTVEMINIRVGRTTPQLGLRLDPLEWKAITSEERRFSVGWVFLSAKHCSNQKNHK